MISLNKVAEPAVLVANKVVWTQEFADFKAKVPGTPKAAGNRYAHEDVRARLEVETHKKCAYCESELEHVSFSEIEHILPKSARPDLVCEWANLTLACKRCNLSKLDYYEPTCPLVNPYSDQVGSHLEFYGPFIYHQT